MKYVFLILSFLLVEFAFAQQGLMRRNIKAPNAIDSLKIDMAFTRNEDGVYRDVISGADCIETGNVPAVRSAQGRAAGFNGLSANHLECTGSIWELGVHDTDPGVGDERTDFTLEAWVFIDDIELPPQVWMSKWGSGTGSYNFFVSGSPFAGRAAVRFFETDGGDAVTITGADGTNFATSGLGHHVIRYTASSGLIEYSINDGTPTSAVVDSTEGSAGNVRFSTNLSGLDVLQGGYVDHIRYWTRRLSDTEVTAFFNNGEGPLPTFHAVRTKGGGTPVEPPPAIAAPNAPALAVSGFTANSVGLTITPSGSGDEATSFTVKYGTTTGVYTETVPVGTNLTPTITSLSASTTYFFVATASNSAGTSGNSNEVSQTTASAGGGTGTYADMRNTTCTLGQIFDLETADGLADGEFECQGSDPHGNGDDNGIVIASGTAGRWWVRQWSYGINGPIELDWYELSDQADITTLTNNLASSFSPNLYMRMPSVNRTLVQGTIDFSCTGHNLERVHILEHPNAQTIIDTPNTALYRIGQRFQNSCAHTLRSVVLGSPVIKGDRDAYNLTFQGPSSGPALRSSGSNRFIDVRVKSTTARPNVTFRAHMKGALIYGLRIFGDGIQQRLDTVRIAGTFTEGGQFAVNGAMVVFMEDTVYYEDTYARGVGWDGTVVGGIAQTDYANYGWHDQPTNHLFMSEIYGSYEQRFGALGWFHSCNCEFIGTQAEPYTMIVEDHGFMPDGTPIENPGIGMQWGKNDAWGRGSVQAESGRRFIKFIDKGANFPDLQAAMGPGLKLENTPGSNQQQRDCPADFHNTYLDITLVNHTTLYSLVDHPCDLGGSGISSNNTYRSDGINPAQTGGGQLRGIGENATVTGDGWMRINMEQPHQAGSTQTECTNASFIDMTFAGSGSFGRVIIPVECTGATFTRVTGQAAAEIETEVAFTVTGVGSIPAGTYRFDSVTLGGTDNLDGTWTIGN